MQTIFAFSSPCVRLRACRFPNGHVQRGSRELPMNGETPMSIGKALLGEFEQEMASTRKVLERIPDEKWNWKPYEKCGTVGWMAGHVATIPGWAAMTVK